MDYTFLDIVLAILVGLNIWSGTYLQSRNFVVAFDYGVAAFLTILVILGLS